MKTKVGSRARQLSGLIMVAVLALSGTGCNRAPSVDVLATVNGKPILRADVERVYRSNLGDSQQQDPSKEAADISRLEILRGLIDDEILQQRAASENLVATDEEVNAKLTELKAPYTQEEFDQRLQARGQTLDDLKRDLRRSLTSDKLQNKEIVSKVNITDTDISSYFTTHKSEFNLIEPRYRLAQIVVTSTPAQQQVGNLQNSKARNEAEAKKKIDMLHNRLDSGEDFSAVAMNFSEQPETASNGGDMGFVLESTLRTDPEVYASVSKLKEGQITSVMPIYDGPSKHVMGYAIYKLISREAAGQRDLNDPRVQQFIRQQLRNQRAQLLRSAYYDILRSQAKVHNYFAEQIFKSAAQ
jgi:peptidyl-prolyl cis-trans isomerase SurA